MEQENATNKSKDPEFVASVLRAIGECRKGDFANLQLVVDYCKWQGFIPGVPESEYHLWLRLSRTAFIVGQTVQWSDEALKGSFANMRVDKMIGKGPFIVGKVEQLTNFCTCGAIVVEAATHHNDCHLVQIKFHPQRLTILTPKGLKKISGVMFKAN